MWFWEGENLREVGLKGISLKQTLLFYDKRIQHIVRAQYHKSTSKQKNRSLSVSLKTLMLMGRKVNLL